MKKTVIASILLTIILYPSEFSMGGNHPEEIITVNDIPGPILLNRYKYEETVRSFFNECKILHKRFDTLKAKIKK